mmetsp:Transcript_39813/g.98437  ORF Transcript_39813/g.98437 Transcript_39813/m.98437 type:complete len:365 (+) Transcript_39813:131-1225(+)
MQTVRGGGGHRQIRAFALAPSPPPHVLIPDWLRWRTSRRCTQRRRNGKSRRRSLKRAGVRLARDRVGTGDNLEQLLRHGRLARTVHLLRQDLAELGRVVGGGLHGAHARGELGRERLLHGAENLAVDVEGEDSVEELRRLLLEEHVRLEVHRRLTRELLALHAELAVVGGQLEDLVSRGLETLRRERHQSAHGWERVDHGDERGVDELNAVDLAGKEVVEDVVGERRGELGAGRRGRGDEVDDVPLAALEPDVCLAADAEELDLDALLLELCHARGRLLNDLRVVPAAQAALARDNNHEHRLGVTLLEEGQVERLILEALDEAAEHLLELPRERARAQHGVLRAAHLGRRDELHRLRDLLGVLD